MKTEKQIKQEIKDVNESLNYEKFILNHETSTPEEIELAKSNIAALETVKHTLQSVIGKFDKSISSIDKDLPF
jgi:ribosomal protein L29